MKKYIFIEENTVNNHWQYCVQHQIPHIELSNIDEDYVNISYDLLPCIPFDKLKSGLMDRIIKIYDGYIDFFQLPKDKFSYVGGVNNLELTIYKINSEYIATQLFDYLSDYVEKNKISLNQ